MSALRTFPRRLSEAKLLAMKNELIELKEKINSLLSKVELGLGLTVGSCLPGPRHMAYFLRPNGVDKRPIVQQDGCKNKALVDGPKMQPGKCGMSNALFLQN